MTPTAPTEEWRHKNRSLLAPQSLPHHLFLHKQHRQDPIRSSQLVGANTNYIQQSLLQWLLHTILDHYRCLLPNKKMARYHWKQNQNRHIVDTVMATSSSQYISIKLLLVHLHLCTIWTDISSNLRTQFVLISVLTCGPLDEIPVNQRHGEKLLPDRLWFLVFKERPQVGSVTDVCSSLITCLLSAATVWLLRALRCKAIVSPQQQGWYEWPVPENFARQEWRLPATSQ